MNKGIVMEVKSDYAIIMNESGFMEKITKKKNMNIGQKIFYFDEDIVKANNVVYLKRHSFMKAITSIAALLFIAFTFFYQISYKEEAYAVVSLDINPSIQIEVDSDKNIIKIEGMNEDGKNLDYSGIEGLNIEQGIEKIKDQLVQKKYLENNKDVLVAFALVGNEDDDNYEETIKGAIKSSFKSETVTFVKGKQEDIAEAKTKGISLGRYEAVQIAGESSKEPLDTAPVKEITELIKDKVNVVQWAEEPVKIEGTTVVDDSSKDKKDNNITETETPSSSSISNEVSNTPQISNEESSSDIQGENVDNNVSDKPKEDVTLNVQPDPQPEPEYTDSVPEADLTEEPIKEPATSTGNAEDSGILEETNIPSENNEEIQ